MATTVDLEELVGGSALDLVLLAPEGRRVATPTDQNVNHAPSTQRTVEPSPTGEPFSTEIGQGVSEAYDISLDPGFAATNLDLASTEDANVGENIISDFLPAQTQVKTAYYPSFEIASLLDAPTALVRSFDRRPDIKSGSQRIASLLLHNLKSYPQMIIRHNNLPPFIHPFSISNDAKDDNMEPLTNCLNLVHMLSSPHRGSRKLFWKNVRLECERCCAEYLGMNRWQLVTAMQALFIYILIRLGEGEMDHNNVDALLVRTVVLTATQFNLINFTGNTQPALHSDSLTSSWKGWILEESARRLCVVYQVLGMLVQFEPAAMCDGADVVLGPLPSRKQLWEASDEKAWIMESEREPPGLQPIFGLAANGDLVSVDESQLVRHADAVLHQKSYDQTTSSWAAANWEDWCSGMDAFGGLIMLAAALKAQ